jgi:hypothetical protein
MVQPGSTGVRRNLLVNGGFEEPDTTDSYEPWGYTYGSIPNPYEYRGPSIPGWQIVGGNVDLVVYHWPPAVGQQSIRLDDGPGGSIEQSFPTEPGRDYLLTGYVSHDTSLSLCRAEVLLDGGPFVALTHDLPTEHTDMKWVAFACRFRATTPTTRMMINNVGGTVLDGLTVRRDEAPNTTAGPPSGPTDASPAAPSGLALGAITANSVTLLWDDNSDNETAFAIWRSDGGSWVQVGAVPPNTTTFTDTGLTPEMRYTYGIRAINGFGTSLWSNGMPVVTLPVVGPVISADAAPTAPSGLKAKGISAHQVTLVWTDNSLNEQAFEVWRKSGGTDWTRAGTVAAETTTFADTSLSAGTSYTYRVRATNQFASEWSNEVTVATLP